MLFTIVIGHWYKLHITSVNNNEKRNVLITVFFFFVGYSKSYGKGTEKM